MQLSFLSAAMVFVASNAVAQHAHQLHLTSETGQSQFVAIAEIVSLLRNDPETDWSQVEIKALRDHLVDMDNVTTKALVERTVDELSATFLITGDEVAAASIQRMVLAHSPMLQQSSDWSVLAQEQEGGAKMMIQASSEDAFNQVLGLGLFGLMTIGAHHQQHHLMIATRQSPH